VTTKSKASSTATDEQISKAFDLRKKGMGIPLIASSTGLPESTLYSWFREPPKRLIERIINTPSLKYLIDSNKKLLEAALENTFLDSDISDQERTTIPVVDRRGTSIGYSSQYGINEEVGRVNRENSESPILTSAMTSEDKLEFQSQDIIEKETDLEDETADTITFQDKEVFIEREKMLGSIKPLEINSKNILELNDKLVNYKLTLSDHLIEVDRLLSGLESLAYIESLENAEVEYQDRIKALEVEIDRLKQAERQL